MHNQKKEYHNNQQEMHKIKFNGQCIRLDKKES